MKKIRSVLVAEDFPLMIDGVKRVLYAIDPAYDIQCVSRLIEAERMLNQRPFDLLVTDIQLHGDKQAGLQLVALARQQYPAIRTVIYTQYDDPDVVQAGILAGAHGYVVKYESEGQLRKVLEEVGGGDEYLSPVVAHALIRLQRRRESNDERPSELSALTLEELSLIRLVSQDIPKKEIAAQKGISPSAVYAQIKRIAEKIGVVGDVGIALFARKYGLI